MRTRPDIAFALATLLPVPLLGLGALIGGVWLVLAVLSLTALLFTLDHLATRAAPYAPPEAEFPAAQALSLTLAILHFPLLALGTAALAGETGLSGPGQCAAFLAFGLYFGHVSNSNAHELIHHAARLPRRLGIAVFISLLYGHHASAHPLVHHTHVATKDDPATASLGQSFWAYLPHAWWGAFTKGLNAELKLRRRKSPNASLWHTPYPAYIAGALLCLALAASFGAKVLIAYLALAAYAQIQIILSDYVQHYGLLRATTPEGKYEPVGAAHSWNAPHRASAALMLNAPRHSDHHAHPTKRYPALYIPQDAPILPLSLPAMATIAMIPTLWRRLMDPRVARLSPIPAFAS